MAVVMGVVCICGISPIKNKPLLETGCYITMYETFINLIMSTIIYSVFLLCFRIIIYQ